MFSGGLRGSWVYWGVLPRLLNLWILSFISFLFNYCIPFLLLHFLFPGHDHICCRHSDLTFINNFRCFINLNIFIQGWYSLISISTWRTIDSYNLFFVYIIGIGLSFVFLGSDRLWFSLGRWRCRKNLYLRRNIILALIKLLSSICLFIFTLTLILSFNLLWGLTLFSFHLVFDFDNRHNFLFSLIQNWSRFLAVISYRRVYLNAAKLLVSGCLRIFLFLFESSLLSWGSFWLFLY